MVIRKTIILKGREQDYLTYREIDDRLFENDQVDDRYAALIGNIAGMGIEALEHISDCETRSPESGEFSNVVEEEAKASLSAVPERDSRLGQDPLGIYLNDLENFKLLDRNQEIELTKRLEDGIRKCALALSQCPASSAQALRLFDRKRARGAPLTDFVKGIKERLPLELTLDSDLKFQVKELLNSLTERESRIIAMRFGIGTNSAHTLDEIGTQFNISRERVRQIESKALRKLRESSSYKHLQTFIEP